MTNEQFDLLMKEVKQQAIDLDYSEEESMADVLTNHVLTGDCEYAGTAMRVCVQLLEFLNPAQKQIIKNNHLK